MGLLSVPLKTVLMYHADLQNEALPDSYEYCDGRLLSSSQQDINPGGTYQLPDLRNRYPIGADLTKAAFNSGDYTLNSASGAPGPKGVAGANIKTLAITEIPAHNHGGGSHTHTGTTSSAGSHNHSVGMPDGSTSSGPEYSSTTAGGSGNRIPAVNGDGTGHSLTIASGGSHSHSFTTGDSGTIISTQGGGVGFDIRPRSYGLIFIMKVKY